MSDISENYGPIGLDLIPPFIYGIEVDSQRDVINRLAVQALGALHLWRPYLEASAQLQDVMCDVVETNLNNSLTHSLNADHSLYDGDANTIQKGSRPHAALFSLEGVTSVEVDATLIASSHEPHNPFSTVHTERALRHILEDPSSQWGVPIAAQPRARFKVTRFINAEDGQEYAVVRSKVDGQGYKDAKRDEAFGIKGRRSGFVDLAKIDDTTREYLETLVKTEDLPPDSIELAQARVAIHSYFAGQPDAYQAVVDRVYVTRQ